MDAALSTRPHTDLPRAGAHAYEELKASILLGRVPMGVRLREERVAKRYGVSRTPAREALLRLHADLTDELRRVNERIRPVRSHDFVTPGRVATTIRQHLEILDAVFARDGDGAAERLDSHIRESQAVVELAVGRALERMLRDEEGELPW